MLGLECEARLPLKSFLTLARPSHPKAKKKNSRKRTQGTQKKEIQQKATKAAKTDNCVSGFFLNSIFVSLVIFCEIPVFRFLHFLAPSPQRFA